VCPKKKFKIFKKINIKKQFEIKHSTLTKCIWFLKKHYLKKNF
jgi:hypothetical protein